MRANYYKLRCAVIETFYETLLEEKYTFGQAASRCLIEFRREMGGADHAKLIVLSILLSRLARHEPSSLNDFRGPVNTLRDLGRQSSLREGLDPSEIARLEEDLRFINEQADSE